MVLTCKVCFMIIRYSKMLFGRPGNRFVVTDIVENCVERMLKIRLLDKHGKLDIECWEKYDPYYIKVLSDDEVIIHLTVLFVLFKFYIIVCKDIKYFINKVKANS